jgi:hypothetical protein
LSPLDVARGDLEPVERSHFLVWSLAKGDKV